MIILLFKAFIARLEGQASRYKAAADHYESDLYEHLEKRIEKIRQARLKTWGSISKNIRSMTGIFPARPGPVPYSQFRTGFQYQVWIITGLTYKF